MSAFRREPDVANRPIADIPAAASFAPMPPLLNHLKRISFQKWAAVALFAVVLLGWFFILTTPPPQLSLAVANGKYVNSEGATLILLDGNISAENRTLGYVIETDKAGAYVLLDGRLVAKNDGTVHLETRSDLMKARLDRDEGPSKIDFFIWPPIPGNPNRVRFERQ